jgi:hypothetical protein
LAISAAISESSLKSNPQLGQNFAVFDNKRPQSGHGFNDGLELFK